MTSPAGTGPRPTKLDELNRAFRCAYIECPAYVIDEIKRRFDEYLAEQLALAAPTGPAAPPPPDELTEAAGHLAWAMETEIQGGHRTRAFITQHHAKCRHWIAEVRRLASQRVTDPVSLAQPSLSPPQDGQHDGDRNKKAGHG